MLNNSYLAIISGGAFLQETIYLGSSMGKTSVCPSEESCKTLFSKQTNFGYELIKKNKLTY